jgi:PhoPQ-activated pathogenicity-related protein
MYWIMFLPLSVTTTTTPWSRALLEKLTDFAARQKIPRIYGTRKFITVPTSSRFLVCYVTVILDPNLGIGQSVVAFCVDCLTSAKQTLRQRKLKTSFNPLSRAFKFCHERRNCIGDTVWRIQ